MVTRDFAPGRRPGRLPSATAVALISAVVAIVAVTVASDPFGASLHDPDAAASVIYFDRIVHGQRLEAFVPTTPKPLLTVLYGIAWSVSGDWRALGLLTLGAFAIAVAVSAALAFRVAGLAAAAFAVAALSLSPAVVGEVAHANSVIWGLAGWAIAGLAFLDGPRRAWLVGLALAAAASFRNESFVLVALATAGVALLAIEPRLRGRTASAGGGTSARAWSPVLLGWLALPLALVHDLLRTGDPLAWLRVPAGYTAITTPNLQPTDPLEFAADVAARFAGAPLLGAVAIVGLAWLIRHRAWGLACGFIGLTVGITALIGFVAVRGVFVTPRYFEQVDLGLIGAAAIGVGAIAAGLAEIGPRRDERIQAALGAGAAVVLAIVVTFPTAAFDRDLARRLDAGRTQSENVEAVLPALRTALAGEPPPPAGGPSEEAPPDPRSATLLVPRPLWTRLALELDAPLTRLADSWLAFRTDGPLASVRAGQAIYHDRAADSPPDLFAPLESDVRIEAGAVALEPVVADPEHGAWVLSVLPAQAVSASARARYGSTARSQL